MASEAQHQTALIKWTEQPSVRKKYPELKLLHHIPNGGSRDAVEGKHLKRQGVKRGVPDLCLPVPRGIYHGLYMEMKTETGKTSPEQDWWLTELAREGYAALICHGWENAKGALIWYLEQNR